MRRPRLTWVVLLLALLTACGPVAPQDPTPEAGPDPDVGTAPEPADDLAPEVSVDRWLLPSSWAGAVAVDPAWDRVLGERDGIVLGLAGTDDGAARLSAVDGQGRVRWTSLRPAGHTEAGLSTVDDTTVVVLTDPGPDGGVSASGYDLGSGAALWGPVDVPGPVVGPGLVVGEGGQGGVPAPAVALDARTGAPVAGSGDEAVVAEADGWVLTAQDGELSGSSPADRSTAAWTTPTASLGLPADVGALAGAAPAGTALLGPTQDDPAGTEPTGTLVEVADGAPVATRVTAAALDSATGTRVTLGAGTVSGHGPAGPLWSRSAAPDAELAAVGGALVYLREGDAVRVLNALSGAEAVAYEGDPREGYVVPTVVTSTGAAVARTDRLVLLTTEAAPAS